MDGLADGLPVDATGIGLWLSDMGAEQRAILVEGLASFIEKRIGQAQLRA